MAITKTYISSTASKKGTSTGTSGDSALDYRPIKSANFKPNRKPMVFNWKQELVCSSSDGNEQSYDLQYTPISDESVSIYINGLLQRQNIDYTVSGKTITFSEVLPAGFNIVAKYNANNKKEGSL